MGRLAGLGQSVPMAQSLCQCAWGRLEQLQGHGPLPPSPPRTCGCSPLHPSRQAQGRGAWHTPSAQGTGAWHVQGCGSPWSHLLSWLCGLGLEVRSSGTLGLWFPRTPVLQRPQTPSPGPPHPTVSSEWGWPLGSTKALWWGHGHAPWQGAGGSCRASQRR